MAPVPASHKKTVKKTVGKKKPGPKSLKKPVKKTVGKKKPGPKKHTYTAWDKQKKSFLVLKKVDQLRKIAKSKGIKLSNKGVPLKKSSLIRAILNKSIYKK